MNWILDRIGWIFRQNSLEGVVFNGALTMQDILILSVYC